MAGHSKWAQIKRAKGVADVKRGLAFTKLSTLISVAVREGGGIADPSLNMRLRVIVERAKQANMPKENISRAIERALNSGGEANREMIYEGFWKNGVNMLILANTDNPNRSVSAVRNVIEKLGGKLGSIGSVIHQFQKCLLLEIANPLNEEELLDLAEQTDAIEIISGEGNPRLYLPFSGGAKNIPSNIEVVNLKTHFFAHNCVSLSSEQIDEYLILEEKLEELDDVVEIFTNIE